MSGWLIERNRYIHSSLTETVILLICGKSSLSPFSARFSSPVLKPGRTGGWFLLKPGNLSQWCGTIHGWQPWQERFAIHAPGSHRGCLVGQVFFVLELAQQPLLIILFGVSEGGVLATSDICSGNWPVWHDGERRFSTAVLTGRNIRWPKGQFHLPDSPFPMARNSMERPREPLPLALSERKSPSCKQKGAFWQ